MGIRDMRENFTETINASKKFLNDDVIAEVAEELDLPVALVAEIVDSQFQFVAHTMRAGGMENIIIPYLGKFKVNPYQVQKMMANSMKS